MIELRVNSIDRTFDGDPEMPLLWYLRDTLGLTGTKFACGVALCGVCTVHKNGEELRACVTPMSSLAGTEIRTIEDVGARGLYPVRKNMDATQHPAVRLLPVRTNHASHCVG
jgi:isoquinoline 1-oxidoreductase alpha subunit